MKKQNENKNDIPEQRKIEIRELAEYVSNRYCPNGAVSPEHIAKSQNITFSIGHYGDCFDGILEYKSKKFHIYLNCDKFGTNKERIRFSFAHELGHYYINEHRTQLTKGRSLHKSYSSLIQKNIVEKEADYFAACLLMPSNRFIIMATAKVFDFSIVELLKKEFEVSFSSVLFRLLEVDIYSLMIVYSKNSIMKHRWFSPDFQYKYITNFHNDIKQLPPNTVAAEYFADGTKYDNDEIVNATDWFDSYQDISDVTLKERCIYMSSNNIVISILWL